MRIIIVRSLDQNMLFFVLNDDNINFISSKDPDFVGADLKALMHTKSSP